MPNRAKIKVTAPAQGDVDVRVYAPDGSTAAAAFTTQAGSTAVSFPVAIEAGDTTTMWVQEGPHVVSIKSGAVEIAAGYGEQWAGAVDNDGIDLRPSAPVGAFAARVVVEHIGVAVGDEATALSTGTAKVTFRMPFAMTVTAVRANVNTVSSSGAITVDINDGGTSILSTKLTIDQSEKTSVTAATAAVISDSALADDAEITIDIDGAGSGAKGLKVWIIGTRSV